MRADSLTGTGLFVAAAACLCLMFALGAYVSRRTPTRVDVEATALRGTGVPLALFFTALGRWPVLMALGVAAASLRIGLVAVATLVAAQILAQGANTLFKIAFRRPRPDEWLRVKELDLSYPSGHAVSAVVFFAGFAILAGHAPLPRLAAALLVAVLAACAVGIPWSRLALGAHYLTDVAGGLLFGAAVLCVALAAIARTYGVTAPR